MTPRLTILALALALLASAAHVGSARAAGGNYVFDGGTAYERAQVRQALAVSAFDWSVVQAQVTVHIGRGLPTAAGYGQIWLDADLLDAGQFAWGAVQHEYAHEVDFLVLDGAARQRLAAALGATAWCGSGPDLPHAGYGCERFASTLAWAYWPSAANSMRPTSADDESAAMKPAAFRALLAGILDARALQSLHAVSRQTGAGPSPSPLGSR